MVDEESNEIRNVSDQQQEVNREAAEIEALRLANEEFAMQLQVRKKVIQEQERINQEQTIVEWIKNNDLKSISNFNSTIPDSFFTILGTPYSLATTKEMVKILINKNVDINCKDRRGYNALFFQNKPEVVEELIKNDIDINQKNKNWTPLTWACSSNKKIYRESRLEDAPLNIDEILENDKDIFCLIAYKKYEQDYEKNLLAFKAINKSIPVGLPRHIKLDDKLSLQSLTFKTLITENNLEILYKQNLFENFKKIGLAVNKEKIKEIEKKVNDKIELIEKEKTIIQPSTKNLQEAGPSSRLTQAEIEIEANKEEKISQLSETILLKNKDKQKKSIFEKIKTWCVGPNLTDEQENAIISALENLQKENAKINIANKDEIDREAAKKAEAKQFAAECLEKLKNSNLVAENIRETKISLHDSLQKEKAAQNDEAINKRNYNVRVAEIESKKSYSSFSKNNVQPSTSKNEFNQPINIDDSHIVDNLLSKAPDVPIEAIIETLPVHTEKFSNKKVREDSIAIKEKNDKTFEASERE